MPRRKGAPTGSLDSSQSPAPKKSTAKKFDRIDRLFESYSNHSSGLIEPEGIEALCRHLRVDCADVRILILAWKMKAEKQGYFSKDEWRRGLECLGANTIAKLRKEMDRLGKENIGVTMGPKCLEDFYSYAFQYNLIDHQRTIDNDSACELLKIVLGTAFPTEVNLLIEYLKIQTDYKAINRDQWISFYHFLREVNIEDLEKYDPSQAWPVVIDNFVEWLKEKQKEV